MKKLKGFLALSPIAVFLLVYLAGSIIAHDFYAVPVWAAFLVACLYGLAVLKGGLKQKCLSFLKGASDKGVLQMIGIFILAGAFAGTAKSIGAVDATVAVAMELIPGQMIYAGLFLTACFISMALGTSVGTIVAMVPVAVGLAEETGAGVPFMTAVVVGGSFFGDNLSFISDTTIAATRAMGVKMNEKFKANIRIIWPAVLAVTVIYLVKGLSTGVSVPPFGEPEYVKTIPYLLIIVLGLSGVNVLESLPTGILVNVIIGLWSGSVKALPLAEAALGGVIGMMDLIIVTLLAGGLLELIRINGGIDFIMESLTRNVNGKRGAEASIAGTVCLANLCTANNTIAILTTGGIAKGITDRFGLDPRTSASILDTFSCLVQGLLPYGAQLLMASGLAGLTPVQIIPFLYYPFLMGLCAILRICFAK